MSESHTGLKHSDETKNKMSKSRSGNKNPLYRHDVPSPEDLLIEYENGDITQKEMSKKYNCSLHLIQDRLKKARQKRVD